MRVVPISLVVVLGLVLLPVPATEVASANAAAVVAAPAVPAGLAREKLTTLLQDPYQTATLSFTAPVDARGLLGR